MALLCCATRPALSGTPPKTLTASDLIAQAEHVGTSYRHQLPEILEKLHKIEHQLTPEQRLHLEYFDTLASQHSGNNAATIKLYERVVHQTKDLSLSVRARARLTAMYLNNSNNYLKAYTLANTLLEDYPKITDARTRFNVLIAVTRVKEAQEQYDKALTYVEEMETLATSKQRLCTARAFHTQILFYKGGSLASTQAAYEDAVATCLSADLVAHANALRLDRASMMDDAGHPDQAIELLQRIAPSIHKIGVQTQIASLHVTFAQAYLLQKKYALAKKSALAALASNNPGDYNWTLESAYKVLYKTAQKQGDPATALTMYQKYIDQYKATTDDAQAQAMAYQMVKQDVLAKKLKLEELSKQNKILQLRQSLDRKSAETSRLYILLLLFVLASIGFWAYRTKHSQLRFRRMAREDDLTGTFNRQHFLDCASRLLQRMQKTDNEACLMILDMDHFKRVNDMYGHITGDVVLKHVTNICRHELRTSDVFGRLGGEEFGILMPGCTPQQGKEVGDRMRRALVNAPIQVLENESLTITASIGLASTRTSGYQLKRLLVHADEALYEAKRNGRNQLMISSGAASPETAAQPG
ncbi:hypothetical protein GCM10027285_03960 [Oleiagrimonas citrea]